MPWQVQFSDASHQISKSRDFFYEMNKMFCGWIISFQTALTLAVLQIIKSLLDIDGTIIQDVGYLAPMEHGVHTMSLYSKFRITYFWLLNEN